MQPCLARMFSAWYSLQVWRLVQEFRGKGMATRKVDVYTYTQGAPARAARAGGLGRDFTLDGLRYIVFSV